MTMTAFTPGAPWLDTDGQPIQAHGGGLLLHEGTYYWYGEDKRLGHCNRTGVSGYASTDLLNWRNLGVVLPKDALPQQFREHGICERPKVIRSAATGLFVMWMHLDSGSYHVREAGVAVAERPEGPFRFLRDFRPLRHPVAQADDHPLQENRLGGAVADLNLFVDDDGAAYVIYASEENRTLYIARLDAACTDVVRPAELGKTWARLMVDERREAPALFRCRGRYHLITSGLTGWAPNPARYHVADHPLGPWRTVGDPCVGPEAETTFRSQSTCVIPAPGKPEGCFIYLGDRWNCHRIDDSRYVWLPFVMHEDGAIVLEPFDRWTMTVFDRATAALVAPQVRAEVEGGGTSLRWTAVPGAVAYRIYENGQCVGFTTACSFVLPPRLPGRSAAWVVVGRDAQGRASPPSAATVVASPPARTTWLSTFQPDAWTQGFGSPGYDQAILQSPLAIAGREFAHGVATHAICELRYGIGGAFVRFEAMIGLDDSHRGGSVTFEVYADGVRRFASEVVRTGTPAQAIAVDLRHVQELRLVVTDAGDGTGNDHANWADARLVAAGDG